MQEIDSREDISEALRLWVIMNRAVASIEKKLKAQVRQHDLSFTEFAVLEVLLHKGQLPISEIGDLVLLTSGSMTYVIDKLEDRGLIHRCPCPDDRRVTYADLTDEGREVITNVFDEHAELLGQLTSILDTDEKRTASELLKRMGRFASEQEIPTGD